MKKVISVVLSFIIIFAAAGIPAAADIKTFDITETGELYIPANEYSSSFDASENSTEIKIEGGNISFNQNDYVEYVLNVPKSGIYSVVTYASTAEGKTVAFDIMVDGELAYRQAVYGIGYSYHKSLYSYVYLEAGTKTLKILNVSGGMYLANVKIKYKTDVFEYGNDGSISFVQEDQRIVFATDTEQEGIYKLDLTGQRSTNADIYIYSNDNYLNSFNVPKNLKESTKSVMIRLKKGRNIIKMKLASGSINAKAVKLDLLTAQDEDAIKEVIGKVEKAENGNDVYNIIKTNKNILGIDIDALTTTLTYPEFVCLRLADRKFTSELDFYNALFDAVDAETSAPSVKTSVSSSKMTVTAKTDIYKKDGVFAAALYSGNRLVSMNFNSYTKGKDVSVALDGYANGMTLKFFTFDTISEINPSDLSNGVCKELFVSTSGNDETGDGSSEHPFKTIKRAKEETANLTSSMTGDIKVNIAPGYYELSQTEVFEEVHGGNDSYKVVYRGTDKDNPPVISGGKKVTGWTEAGNGIYSAPLSGNQVRDLFVGDYPAVRARSSYTYVLDEYIDDLTISVSKSGMPNSFAHPEDLVFVWDLYWSTQYTPVESAVDNGDSMTFKMESIFDEYVGTSNIRIEEKKRFYMENALELLDEEGEFYHDAHAGVIYYKPYKGENLQTTDTYVSNLDTMIEVSGEGKDSRIKNLVFDGIAFKYGTRNSDSVMQIQADQHYNDGVEYKMPGQFVINCADSVAIKNCEFSCIGSSAIDIKDAVSNSLIKGNLIKDIGGCGISVGNFMRPRVDGEAEMCSDITVSDNVLRRTSLIYRGTTAIAVYYENNIDIIKNDIADTPYTGITAGWGWGTAREKFGNIRISKNRIHNVMQTLTDGGHIYTLGNMPGSVISENYMTKSGDYRGGIYTDSGSQNIDILNNVCDNSSLWWHVGLYYTKNMTAVGNITPRNFVNDSGENIVIKDHIEVSDGNFMTAGSDIINNAGVSSEYKYLLDKAALAEGRELPLSIPNETYKETQESWIEAEDFEPVFNVGYRAHNFNEPYNNIYRAEGLNLYRNYLTNKGYYIHRVAKGDWMTYKVTVPEDGIYYFDLKAANGYDDSYNTIVDISVDGNLTFDNAKFPNTKEWYMFTPVRMGLLELTKGTHTIKIEYAGSGFHIDAFRLKKASEIRIPMKNHTSAYCSLKGTDYLYVEGGTATWHINDWAEYEVKIDTPGTYRFGMEFGSSVGAGLKNSVSVNGVEKLNTLKSSKGTYNDRKDVDFGDITFSQAGTYTVKIKNTGGDGGHYVGDFYLVNLNEVLK